MHTTTRRQFLQSSLFAGTGLVLGAGSAAAIEPIHRTGSSHMRLSLAAYSFRQELDLKRKPTMTFDDFIVGMKKFGERIQPLMKCRADRLKAAA